MTVPEETVRAASLPSDYRDLSDMAHTQSNCDCHRGEDKDTFLRRCVNSGIPLRVGSAIDAQVIRILTDAGIRKDVPATGDSG